MSRNRDPIRKQRALERMNEHRREGEPVAVGRKRRWGLLTQVRPTIPNVQPGEVPDGPER